MSTFLAQSKGDGTINLGSEYQRKRFREDLIKNKGARYKIERITPESRDQRNFFEGAVIPLIVYYQEGMSHRNYDDNARMRHWLKVEFNGEILVVKGKPNKVPKTTKGELNKGFLERVIDWMAEQGYKVELLNPTDYKHWRDVVFPTGEGPDNYIDYLVWIGKL